MDIVGSASTFLYFGYTSVMVFCFFLLTGESRNPKKFQRPFFKDVFFKFCLNPNFLILWCYVFSHFLNRQSIEALLNTCAPDCATCPIILNNRQLNIFSNFPFSRHNRIPRLLLVCSEDLQCGQSRLEDLQECGLEKLCTGRISLPHQYLFVSSTCNFPLSILISRFVAFLEPNFSWFQGFWHLVLILGPGPLMLGLWYLLVPESCGSVSWSWNLGTNQAFPQEQCSCSLKLPCDSEVKKKEEFCHHVLRLYKSHSDCNKYLWMSWILQILCFIYSSWFCLSLSEELYR